MDPSRGWNEDRLHRWLAAELAPRGLVGTFGDDAAVLRAGGGRPVLCVDQTVEGVHFEPGTAARHVGAKAAGRVLSDLAAKAARPRALLLAVTAARERPERWLRALVLAVQSRARDFGAELVGGDLCARSGPTHVTVSGLGVVAAGTPPGRDRARPGDVIVITGPTGGSRLGRHLALEPRVAAGRWLAARGARAMMDVSDGLALDLERLANRSGVAIDLEHVPVHRDARRAARASGRDATWHALHDGEDHELVAALPPDAAEHALRTGRRRFPGLARVGRVRAGRGLRVPGPDGTLVPWSAAEGGWIHGR